MRIFYAGMGITRKAYRRMIARRGVKSLLLTYYDLAEEGPRVSGNQTWIFREIKKQKRGKV